MKRILLALTMVGFLLPLAPRAQADTEVSLNLFYDNLSPYGNWIEVGDYGYCFQPNVAVSSSDWRPYADGYWAYTDVGWTWVSYEDFGWATYHYGRWSNLEDYGWVWVPGYEWGPAWVSWRTGGDYIGWAPLPPFGNRIYEGRAITGGVDVEFDIGPLYYNFVDIRYIGEPVLRGRIFAPTRNLTIINQTVNVTNITYNNSVVYNYGPDYNRLNQYSTRPIQRLSLQRETTVGANFGAQVGKRANLNRVNGNQLMVVAPAIQRSQAQIAPKQVKAKVQQPKVERGWQGVANRQQLQEEMKKENAQNVRPPSFQPQKDRKRDASAAGQNATAQPNEAAPAVGNDQQAARAARQAQREGRNPNAGQPQPPNANGNGAAEQRRAERAQKAPERQVQQSQGQEADNNAAKPAERAQEAEAQRSNSQQQQAEQAQESQRAERATRAAQAQQSQRAARAEQAQQAQESQQAERAKRAAQAQESQRAPRAEQAQPAQETQRPAERARRIQEARRPQQPAQPERVQRPQQIQRPEQARPPQPQGNPNPDGERKNKKKKPGEEPPPQP